MIDKVTLELWPESWQNLFECVHAKGTTIKTQGNFWAAIQELERQFGYTPEEIPAFNVEDIGFVKEEK